MGFVFVFIGIIFIVSSIIVSIFVNKKEITDKNMTINEKSFQNYAKFYGMMIPVDDEFNRKLNKIYRLIVIENVDDINFIAKDTGCTYEECILKIKYLFFHLHILQFSHNYGKMYLITTSGYQVRLFQLSSQIRKSEICSLRIGRFYHNLAVMVEYDYYKNCEVNL